MAPRQHNGYDCGVFICQFAEYASRQAKFDFSQADIKEFREQMVFEIIEKRLLD
jgi:sentrin-specific protease 1